MAELNKTASCGARSGGSDFSATTSLPEQKFLRIRQRAGIRQMAARNFAKLIGAQMKDLTAALISDIFIS